MNGHIYVLLLKQNKYYVGYTERDCMERITEHTQLQGSKWTKKYPFIRLLRYENGTEEDENRITLEYMEKYGWWNVRGGKYCEVDMQEQPKDLNNNGWVNKLYTKIIFFANLLQSVHIFIKRDKRIKCTRCGRYTHTLENCVANIKSNAVPIRDNKKSCGRNNHLVSYCYANTHIKGYLL